MSKVDQRSIVSALFIYRELQRNLHLAWNFPKMEMAGPEKAGRKSEENKTKVLLTHTEDVETETMVNWFVNQLVRQAIESDMARKRNGPATFALRRSQKDAC